MATFNNTNARRGVLLLVVLGMLAMFGLIGIAFVLLASQARRGAEAIDESTNTPTRPPNCSTRPSCRSPAVPATATLR